MRDVLIRLALDVAELAELADYRETYGRAVETLLNYATLNTYASVRALIKNDISIAVLRDMVIMANVREADKFAHEMNKDMFPKK